MVGHSWESMKQKMRAGGEGIQGHRGLTINSESKASLKKPYGMIVLCMKCSLHNGKAKDTKRVRLRVVLALKLLLRIWNLEKRKQELGLL